MTGLCFFHVLLSENPFRADLDPAVFIRLWRAADFNDAGCIRHVSLPSIVIGATKCHIDLSRRCKSAPDIGYRTSSGLNTQVVRSPGLTKEKIQPFSICTSRMGPYSMHPDRTRFFIFCFET